MRFLFESKGKKKISKIPQVRSFWGEEKKKEANISITPHLWSNFLFDY